MTIKFDGTGYLICNSRILSALPLTLVAFGTRSISSGDQSWVTHSQSNADRIITMYLVSSAENKYGLHRSGGSTTSGSTQKTSAPSANATTPQMFAFEVTSTASRSVRFGNSGPATNTIASGTPADDVASHNQVIIGASQFNNGGFGNFVKGELGEVHFFAGVLTTEQYDAMIAGTLKPEDIPGWVDGLTLKDFQPSGTYTSMQGRTFTAVGGVTAGTINWNPYGRVTADITGPVLSSPTGTSSGATTGTASVSTNEGAGTAWCLTLAASASDPDGPTIEASGTSKAVTATGVQSWPTRTGLTTDVPVKNWFYQKDPSGNGSNVVSSASFTPSATNAAPTFTGTIANITGTGGAAITPVTVASAFADTDALTYSASPGGTAWPSGLTINPTTGAISGTVATSTTTGLKVRATDTASQTVDSNAFSVTMSAAPVAGTLTTQAFKNGVGQVLANLTGLNVSVLAVPSGAFVKSFASETTDAGGFNSITDTLIVPGTKYAHITINSTGTVIGAELITAT